MAHLQIRKMQCVSEGDTTETVKLDTLPADKLFCWARIVALDADSTTRVKRIYLERGASQYTLHQEKPAQAVGAVVVSGSIIVPGDYRICADFISVTSGFAIELYAYGYEVDPDALS